MITTANPPIRTWFYFKEYSFRILVSTGIKKKVLGLKDLQRISNSISKSKYLLSLFILSNNFCEIFHQCLTSVRKYSIKHGS